MQRKCAYLSYELVRNSSENSPGYTTSLKAKCALHGSSLLCFLEPHQNIENIEKATVNNKRAVLQK